MAGEYWTGNLGIFEDKGSWVANNDPHHEGNGIDLDDFTAEGDDYISPLVETWDMTDDPEIKYTPLPSRNTMGIGVGKTSLTIDFTIHCIDDSNSTAEEKAQKVLDFMRTHKNVTDNAVYLVLARYINSAWQYVKFEDNLGNINLKYLKGKLDVNNPYYESFGHIIIVAQFVEAWIP